jgi:hypothetical protein
VRHPGGPGELAQGETVEAVLVEVAFGGRDESRSEVVGWWRHVDSVYHKM